MINYGEFEYRCRTKRRYVRDDECGEFLSLLTETASAREAQLSPDTLLQRAQVGCGSVGTGQYCEDGVEIELDAAYPRERMKPLPAGPEGRLNPKGVSFLYLASDEETAVAEVRPHVNARVSVSEFAPTRILRLADCAQHHDAGPFAVPFGELHGPTPKSIWMAIDLAFSHPIQDSETSASYVPTQIIAELLQSLNFDGVRFKSSLGPGFCITLFDPSLANPISGRLLTVNDIKYEHSESAGAVGWQPDEECSQVS